MREFPGRFLPVIGCVVVLVMAGEANAGSLFPGQKFQTGNNPISAVVADLDGDAIPDVETANSSGSVSALLGKGDGTFEAAVSFSAGFYPQSVAVGDLNGDTVPDLVTANAGFSSGGGDNIRVLLGNGDGTFHGAYSTGGLVLSVAVSDFNGDTIPDIVDVFDWFIGAEVRVLLGNGDGTVQASVSFAVGDAPWSVAPGRSPVQRAQTHMWCSASLHAPLTSQSNARRADSCYDRSSRVRLTIDPCARRNI